MLEDTIIAVSTPAGPGGLGIVRLSGRDAVDIARRIFRPRRGGHDGFPVHRLVLGEISDPETGDVIDECFLAYFKAPNSYTREDIIELSCHGSPAILEETVRLGIHAGARPAGPGEFTLRAYLNGRLDMVQAEAVNDLICSMTLDQARRSVRQVLGGLSRKLHSMRETLVSLASGLESGLEFPEERLGLTPEEEARAIDRTLLVLDELISSFEAGRAIGEGITVAVAGGKNVGKSTVFNAILKEERSIVTPYPGTTRDFIKEHLVLDGYVFHLVDTAGLGASDDPVESIGISKSWRIAEEADGLILVIDGSKKFTDEDKTLVKSLSGRKIVVVLNKIDLPKKTGPASVAEVLPGRPVVEVSALTGMNMEGLRRELFRSFAPQEDPGLDVIMHARQRDTLAGMREALSKARELIVSGYPDELCAEEIRLVLRLMGELTGEIRSEDVMNDIFGRFCVGK